MASTSADTAPSSSDSHCSPRKDLPNGFIEYPPDETIAKAEDVPVETNDKVEERKSGESGTEGGEAATATGEEGQSGEASAGEGGGGRGAEVGGEEPAAGNNDSSNNEEETEEDSR